MDPRGITDGNQMSRLFRVRLNVPEEVKKGTKIEVFLDLTLAKKYMDQAEQLLEIAKQAEDRGWITSLDVIAYDPSYTSVQAARNGGTYPTSLTEHLSFKNTPRLFRGETYTLRGEISPDPSAEKITIEGRVRTKYGYGSSPWQSPWMDTKDVRIVGR